MRSTVKRGISLLLTLTLIFGLFSGAGLRVNAATNLSLDVNGLSASYDNGTWTASGTTLNGSATGTASGTCSDASSTTSTLTLTNNKGSAAVLSFTYAKPVLGSGGSVTIDGTSVTAAGSFSKNLANGGKITIVIYSGSAGAITSSIEINNLSLVTEQTVTTYFQPAEEGGTYSVDGRTISEAWENTQSSTTAYTLKASPASGYKLLGWYSSVEGYFSSETTLSKMFEKTQTVKAIFTRQENPVFDVNGVWYTDLTQAIDYAVSAKVNKITLIANGTVPAGNYTIPSGKTLLVPYESTGIISTTQADLVKSAASTPSEFRRLTLASGVNLTVQGALCVNAKVNSHNNNHTGVTVGKFGRLELSAGSSVTLASGANLYSWGYITGSGEITAESGATVYEPFQIADIRGGSATSSMNGNSQKVLPFTQYYVQNIESPLTIKYGATEYVVGSITIQNSTENPKITFIGSSGMFSISSGTSFRKSYDPATDRNTYEVTGNASLNSISMNIYVSVNSANYVMPIMESTEVVVHSGTVTVNQDLCMIPGSRLTVDEGAAVTIASGKNVYVYDRDEWVGGLFIYPTSDCVPAFYSPTRKAKFSTAGMNDARIDVNGTVNAAGYLYTTASGADITSSGKSGRVQFTAAPKASTTTYQATQSGTSISYTSISATAPKLHNTDTSTSAGEYTATAGASAGNYYSFCPVHNVWEKGDPHEGPAHEHTWGEPVWTWSSDYSSASATFTCTGDSSHQKNVAATITSSVVPADCLNAGKTVYTASVTFEGKSYSDVKEAAIPALGHSWQAPTYSWSNDNASVTAQRVCARDSTHKETETVQTVSVTVEPGCETEGSITYTATFENPAFAAQTKTVTLSAAGHSWGTPTYTWTSDNSKVTAERICTKYASHVERETANTTSTVTKEPGCETSGIRTYTASFTNAAFAVQTKTVEIPATGHTWGTPTYTWASDNSTVTAERVCAKDASHVERETANTTSTVTKEPGCETSGTRTYTASFTNSAFAVQTKTEVIPATGHTWQAPKYEWSSDNSKVTATRVCANDPTHKESETANTVYSVTKEATCLEEGTGLYTATFSNEAFEVQTKTEVIPATGHDWQAPTYEWFTDNSKVTATRVCANDGSHNETEIAETTYTVTKEATCDMDGTGVYTALFENTAFTKQTKEVAIPATGHDYEFTVWNWIGNDTDGYTAATAKFVCKKDASHISDQPADITKTSSDSTCTTPGTVVYTATVTFEEKTYTDTKTVTGVALGHDWGEPEWTWEGNDEAGYTKATATFICKRDTSHKEIKNAEITKETTPATCEKAGKIVYTAKATLEGKEYTSTKEVTIPATGHDYEFTGWNWTGSDAEGYTAATVTFTCKNDASHKEPVNAVVTPVTTPATCEAAGQTVYTAKATFEGKEYTDSKTVVTPALGHDYELTGWTWIGNDTEGYTGATVTFTCKNDASHKKPVNAVVTSETTPATCEEVGKTVYTAKATFEGKEYTDSKTVAIPALGHDYELTGWTWIGNDTDGYTAATLTFTCKNDASHKKPISAVVTSETTPATCEEAGKTVYTAKATFEGKEYTDSKTVVIQALGHDYELTGWNWTGSDATGYTAATVTFTCKNDASHKKPISAVVTSETTPATCEAAGKTVYTAKASFEGKEYTDSKTVVIPAFGHDYEFAEWIWREEENADHIEAFAKFVCKHDASHEVTEEATISRDIIPATCEEDGKTIFIAKVSFEGETYTDTREVVIPAIGHSYVLTGWTWTGNDAEGYTAAAATFTCRFDETHVQKVEAKLTKEIKDPTCTEDGLAKYIAQVTFEEKDYSDTKEVVLYATGHKWNEPTYSWSEDLSEATAEKVCANDPKHKESETVKTTYAVTKKPTCEESGIGTYTAAFTNKSFMSQTKDVEIPPLGHAYELTGWNWVGNETEGYTEASAVFTCKNDTAHVLNIPAVVTSEAAGGKRTYTAAAEYEGKQYKDTREVLLAIELDRTELILKSESDEKLTVKYAGTDEEPKDAVWSSSDESIVSVDESGKLTQKKAGYATITVKANGFEAACEILVLFDDVRNQEKYYYEPVYWALKQNITTGKAAYEFVPEGNCTRAEVVTFLWRLYGSPEAAEDSGFSDVPAGKWYSKAISWAVANEITTGYKDKDGNPTGVFGLNDTCKREEVVTFLWRAAGKPEAETDSGFTDVPAGKWYSDAINWAAENEITTGYKDSEGNPTGYFGRGDLCLRGEIITFLYRYDGLE